jgi:predicted nucleotidyltransferase
MNHSNQITSSTNTNTNQDNTNKDLLIATDNVASNTMNITHKNPLVLDQTQNENQAGAPIKVRSSHPVDPVVREQIMEQLADIEQRHNVTVLYACESGSRGWGFASPDSDYDVRFVYVHRLPWYLRIEPARDVIEIPIKGDLDINGWELRKTLYQIKRSNPVIYEWLDSPIVYRWDSHWAPRLKTLAQEFFWPVKGCHHYLSIAHNNFRAYLQSDVVRYKKYLYVLRPLCAMQWIKQGRGNAPIRFADLVEAVIDDQNVIAEINELLALKMGASESEYGPAMPAINQFIRTALETELPDPNFLKPCCQEATLDAFLHDVVISQ